MKCFVYLFLLSLNAVNSSPCKLGSQAWFDDSNSCINREKIKVVTITHGGRSDSFWDVVEDAVLRAGRDLGVESIYRTPQVFDLDAMNKLVEEAIEESPDGLILRLIFLKKT